MDIPANKEEETGPLGGPIKSILRRARKSG